MARLADKVAIITGGAQGIGAAFAKGLAGEGAAVCVCDLDDPANTVRIIEQAGGRAIGVRADIADGKAVSAMVDHAVARFGTIHILINNAAMFGKLRPKPFTEIPAEEWDAVMRVNVRGSVECAKACIPTMRKQQYGKIVNIASGTALKGSPGMLHYVSSKGAVIAMTRALAREVGPDGVRVNCIAPGLTMSESMLASDYATKGTANNIAARAIKREERPEDLVGSAIFLSSPESDFITGQIIVVNGGDHMH
jgi:NAD(P)-dependent dehydrogenase (short-subunit alcohol dehydrogenase family)